MPNHNEVWTVKKYLLYDFAQDRLASTTLFARYEVAAQAANGLANVMIVPVVLEQAEAPAGSQPTHSQLPASA